MAVPSLPSKPELRHQALQRRKDYARALAPALRERLEEALAEVMPHLIEARIIAGYHPMRDEISPQHLLDRVAPGQTAAIPWFADRDARMMFRKAPALEVGPWGVLQPPADAEAVSPDVVLVPLVLADRLGTRIGQGKGHYDRALAHLRAAGPLFTIGIAWDLQIAEEPLPPDPWDVPLDAIATPTEWISCRTNRRGESPQAPDSSSS